MAQFDVFRLGREFAPFSYCIEIQSNFLHGLPSRVMIPLLPLERSSPPIPRLNPVVNVDDRPYVALVELLESIPAKALKKSVGTAADKRTEFISALDFLITGF